MSMKDIVYDEFIDQYSCVGSVVLSDKKYAVIISPRSDPSRPQFLLHQFDTDYPNYEDFLNDENDIRIRLDRPEYVYEDRGLLTDSDKILLNEFLDKEKTYGSESNWMMLCIYWWFLHDVNVSEICDKPDYTTIR